MTLRSSRTRARSRVAAATLRGTAAIACLLAPGSAVALDKQTPAHSKDTGGDAPDTLSVSGQVFVGVLPYNPTYAARPDNSGHALFRAGGHADVNLLGEHLFLPLDVNMFTDRDGNAVRPSELDFIGGVATTWDVLGGKGELGVRAEVDASVDGHGPAQAYGDIRARYVVSLAENVPALGPALGDGDVTGWLAFGWFAWNPSYYARPDNTGHALFRYVAHVSGSTWRRRLGLSLDATFFTDSRANAVRPSELDLTVGVPLTLGPWELMAAYERDMPVDGLGTGKVQHMAMFVVTRSFEGWRLSPREARPP